MQRILITGSNRGIGLALTKIALENGDTVFAACRNPAQATDLKALKDEYPQHLQIITLDVNDEASIMDSVEQVRAFTGSLDVLINNAAINPPSTQNLDTLTMDEVDHVLRVNIAGPLLTVKAYLPLLKKGNHPRVSMTTSGLGSITLNAGSTYAYSISKTGLNMAAHLLAIDLRSEGIIVIALDPGWVKTDMGGPGAVMEPSTSARKQWQIINNLTIQDTGRFLRHDGANVPW